MRLSATGFKQLLQQNVVEAHFSRRIPKAGWRATRRMLCTLDRNLLNSMAGRVALNFNNPTHPPAYPPQAYNLTIVYDLFYQDWRAVPAETLDVVSVIPSHTKPQQDAFWAYFSTFLARLTPQDKEAFMNT